MFGMNRGMRLSTRGLPISGLQVVKSDNGRYRDEIFVLKDEDTIESYTYDPLSSTGFTLNGSAGVFLAKAQEYLLENGNEKIMEIAGGTDGTLKVRYDSGTCLIGTRTHGGDFIISPLDNIARITKHAEYSVSTPIKYYKSGAGTAPLFPLLDGDLVAVFEGEDGDFKVTVAEAIASTEGAIIGKVGDSTVFMNGGVKSIMLAGGTETIEGFGTIVRKIDGTREIKMYTQISSGADERVDHSNKFSPEHYAYIQAPRIDSINSWAGIGNTGYVVDMGDSAHMTVPIVEATPTVDDTIPFVVQSGVMKKITNGTLETIDRQDIDGQALISYIYGHDMTEHVVASAGLSEVEPFSINGYFFGYGDGHLVDADLQNL